MYELPLAIDSFFSLLLSLVVQLILHLPVVFHEILIIGFIFEVILPSSRNFVRKITVFVSKHDLLAKTVLFILKFFESIVHHLFLE
jgi:hypothetical protein